MDHQANADTAIEHLAPAARPSGCPSADAWYSPRLLSLVQLVNEMTDDEMRVLPVALGEAIFALERRRIAVLQGHLGEHCDVIWPGQAEMLDVTLVSVDPESATARVRSASGRQGFGVPAYSIVLRR